MTTTERSRPLDAALDYLERGWQPLPVPYRGKNPGRDGWQKEHRSRVDVKTDFAGRTNIGVLLGEPSNGLVDVDQDCREAALLARQFLPKTGSVFGRESEPHRHWLYYCDPIPRTKRYKDVKSDGTDGETLLEIRSTGGQTVFPPSTHQDTAEIIRWDRDDEPLTVNGDELLSLVGRMAAATLLARRWPSEGGRHDASLALAGGLVRAGWPQEQIEAFIEAIARVAGDEEWEARARNVETTIRRHKANEEVVGFPTLANVLGDKLVDRVREWLDLRSDPASGISLNLGKVSDGICLEDFRAYMPDHKYVFLPTRELWVASSVSNRLPRIDTGKKNKDGEAITVSAASWLDKHRAVEQMTWAPGEPMLVENKLMADGHWIERAGVTCFNLYRPPAISLGNANDAVPWLEHVYALYPAESRHLILWLAHRVQRPWEKINHGIVLGGAQGIGKDTILEPVKRAVGPWNFSETSPVQLLGRFNGFVMSVILRVSEVRDLGDNDRGLNRYQLYEHMKTFLASPPDALRVDRKHQNEISVPNVCGIIITTNHKADGLYLPPDDRRHFVAWSDLTIDDFAPDHWATLYRWFHTGGYEHVAAYLNSLDISSFDPKAPPPKTRAFWDVVDAGRAPEDSEIADILEVMGWPLAVTLSEITGRASLELSSWLSDRKSSRQIPHRMEAVGYTRVRNDAAQDGLWKIKGKRQAIYGKKELTDRERLIAARERSGE